MRIHIISREEVYKCIRNIPLKYCQIVFFANSTIHAMWCTYQFYYCIAIVIKFAILKNCMWDEWQYCLILNAAASTIAYCLFNLNYIQTIYVDIQLWRDFKIHKVHLKHFRQTYKSFSFIRVHQCLKIKSTDVWTEIEIGMTTYMF